MKELKIYNTLRVSCESAAESSWEESPIAYADEITDAVARDDIDLAEYVDDADGDFYKKLESIRMGTEVYKGELYGVAICMVSDDWSEDDTRQLKEYLTGQYADGWGEGFEQHEIATDYTTEEFEEFDDETGEEYTWYDDVRYDVYVSFWQSSRFFRIMTENELKATA